MQWEITVFWMLLMPVFTGTALISTANGATPPQKPAMQQPQQVRDVIYRYNPQGRIDPFTPLVRPEVAAKKKNEKALPLNPLQRLGIEQLRLVGIVEGERGRRAMVQDPSGKFYSLIQGTYIGLYNGRVENILKDSVIIREKFITDEGKVKPRKQIMKLRQNEVQP